MNNSEFEDPNDLPTYDEILKYSNPIHLALNYSVRGWFIWTILGVLASVIISLIMTVPFGKNALSIFLGSLAGGGFFLITGIMVVLSSKWSPNMQMLGILGSWVIKMLIAIIIFAILKKQDFIDHIWLAVGTIGAIIVFCGSDIFAITRDKSTYVETKP